MFCRFIALFLLFLSLVSCSSKKEGSENIVLESVINGYNSALSEAYRDLEPSYIKPYCTAEQMHRLTSIVQGMMVQNKTLRIEQEGIEFLSAVVDGDEAEVRTHEKWTYWNVDAKTGELVNSKATEEYDILYYLKKDNGKWLVDSLVDA